MNWLSRLIEFFKKYFSEAELPIINEKPVIMPIINSPGRYAFYCPGCDTNHVINTNSDINPFHTLTGTMSKPTIRASIMSNPPNLKNKVRCHSFITEGKIEFLPDSTHRSAGQTVDLLPF